MVDTRDILLKAAEDVTQGMWCKGFWFEGADETEAAAPRVTLRLIEERGLLERRRCAEGSIALSNALLGGETSSYFDALHLVREALPSCSCLGAGESQIPHFNDVHLPDDPFEAGQQLAELFRSTAETLGRR